MLQKKTKIVRQKATRRALISFRHYCPREFMLGRETKPDISCEWNTKFSIIPEIPTNRVHSKRIPKFSKTFPGIFTVPFNFEPEISEFLVEWKAPNGFWRNSTGLIWRHLGSVPQTQGTQCLHVIDTGNPMFTCD